MRDGETGPLKFRLAEAELRVTVPCPQCARDLRVPAPGKFVPQSIGAACICGAAYHVHVPRLKQGEAYEIAFEEVRR